MARLRSSAAVGAAGSAKPGGVPLPSPEAPSPPVSKSSLLPSYAAVTTDPLATNDGSAFWSEPPWQAANARHSGSARFDKGPSGILLERYKSGDGGPMNGAEVDVGNRRHFAAVCCLDAEPARGGGPRARLLARRGPRLALRAPRAAPAGRPFAGAEGPRGGPAGDARRLPLQEDRLLAGPARAGHRLGLARAVGELHAAPAPRPRHRLRRGAPRARPAQARRPVAAGVGAAGGGGAAARADAGGAAARGGGDHRLEPGFGADGAAVRALAECVRGRGRRGQGPSGKGQGLGAAVAEVALPRAGLLGGGVRRQALARAAAWLASSRGTGRSIHGSIS